MCLGSPQPTGVFLSRITTKGAHQAVVNPGWYGPMCSSVRRGLTLPRHPRTFTEPRKASPCSEPETLPSPALGTNSLFLYPYKMEPSFAF